MNKHPILPLYVPLPELTAIEEKCLAYSFLYEVYAKNACHTKFIQHLKNDLKFFDEHFFCLFSSFEAFWSLKK